MAEKRSNKTQSEETRRKFLKILFGSAALMALPWGRLRLYSVMAAEKKAGAGAKKGKVADTPLPAGETEASPSDPVVTAIGYVSDANKVDRAKYPQHKKGQQCANCALYTSVNPGWGKCQLIQKGVVRAGGWCGSYSAKPAASTSKA